MAEGTEKYKKAFHLADSIVRRIGHILSSAMERVGNPDLVKGGLDRPRIKTLESVARKAEEKRWSVDEAIEKCWDFVGFRVVCNNLQDVSSVLSHKYM